jgi:hypothetical protein
MVAGHLKEGGYRIRWQDIQQQFADYAAAAGIS